MESAASARGELITAGVALLGNRGGPTLTVRAVCRAAGLTERYFYEAFGTRDGFAHAVYDDIARRTQDVLVRSVRQVYDAAAAAEAPITATAVAEAAVSGFVEFVVDRPDDLERCLDSLVQLEPAAHEVVVVDDASRDGTAAAVLAERDPRVRLVSLAQNLGPAGDALHLHPVS